MKMNLLEIVQSVLDSAEDDLVNAIDDTEASDSATRVAREVYFEIVDSGDWEHLNTVDQLDSVSDVTQPTVLEIPSDIVLLDYEEVFKYDKTESGDPKTDIRDVYYESPYAFMNRVSTRNDSSSNMTKYNIASHNNVPMIIQTDKMPEYWTSFDDHYVVMDSFHSVTENTVQGSKSIVQCKKIPTWTNDGAFTPDMPENMFSWYLSKVKMKYHAYYTQKANILDQQETQSGQARHRRKGAKTDGRRKRRSYGRTTPRRT